MQEENLDTTIGGKWETMNFSWSADLNNYTKDIEIAS